MGRLLGYGQPRIRQPRIRQPWVGLFSVGLLIVSLGCSTPEAPTTERYSDFAVAGAETLEGDPLIPRRLFCADATRFGLVLAPEKGLRARVQPLGKSATLHLSGCERRRPWERVLPESTLAVTVLDQNGEVLLEESLRMDGAVGWWQQEFDLASWAGRDVQLELRFQPSSAQAELAGPASNKDVTDQGAAHQETRLSDPRELMLDGLYVAHQLTAEEGLGGTLDESGYPRGGSAFAVNGVEISRMGDSRPAVVPGAPPAPGIANPEPSASAPVQQPGTNAAAPASPTTPDAVVKNQESSEEQAPRQILLISLDTLRHDSIGAFRPPDAGRQLFPTPHLDALATDGQIWRRHYSTEAWTKPAHASLLTGFPPAVYRGPDATIDPAVPTLAQRLSSEGFATHGFVHDCVWLNPRFGFARGFDTYRSGHWNAEQSVRQTLNWISENRDRSFFLFLHTFEPHSDFLRLPYEAPGIDRRTITERWGLPRYGCSQRICGSRRLVMMDDGELGFFPREREILRYLYDAGVGETDRAMGQLFAQLQELGLYDSMMILVTSDHGEMLGEGGELLHGQSLEPVIKVPMIIKWPTGQHQGESMDGLSSHIDIAPTVLEAYGLPTDGLLGSPLQRRRSDRPIFAGTRWRVVVQDEWKATFDEGGGQLVNLRQDPDEQEDLAAKNPVTLRQLRELHSAYNRQFRQLLEELRRQSTVPEEEGQGSDGLTPQEVEELKALGYLGG
ncbi:MAG: sulfatase-like hydrolase/transferase [Acidobacteriota bacterium]